MNKMLDGIIVPAPRYEWEQFISDCKHDLLIGFVETNESIAWLAVVNALDATITAQTKQSFVDIAIKMIEQITHEVQDAQNEAWNASRVEYEAEMKAWGKHEEQEANPWN